MRNTSIFSSLALSLVCLSALGAESPTTSLGRINQLQAEISASIDSSIIYTGESMPLPKGYSMQEWKEAEVAYEQSISQTTDSFTLLRLYEKLAITQMAQKNYKTALTNLKKSLSYETDAEYYDEPYSLHHLYLDIASVEKKLGHKQQVAEALLKSIKLDFYWRLTNLEDYDIIMQEIYQHWLPKDKAFQRDFYEFYIAHYRSSQEYSTLAVFAYNLKKLYTRDDYSQRNCVDLQLCIYDPTLSQAEQLQKIKKYNREIAKQKVFRFADEQYYVDFQIGSNLFDCETWNCEDETIRRNIDTIQYEQEIDKSRCLLLLDVAKLDSLLQKEGCRSAQYRNAFLEFNYKHRIFIGCEAALACLEQINKWDVVTEKDVQWINDSLYACEPYDTSYIGRSGDYLEMMNLYETSCAGDWFYHCGGRNAEIIEKYYALYLPIIKRVYGEKSLKYYSALLGEADYLLSIYSCSPNWDEIVAIDSTQWAETILNAKPMSPVRMGKVSENLTTVLKEWNDEGSEAERLEMYRDIISLGIQTYDAEVLDIVLIKLEELSKNTSLTDKQQERITRNIYSANMYRAILRKDVPLFLETAQKFAHFEFFNEYMGTSLDNYLKTYQCY